MGTSLTGVKIKDSYDAIIKVSDNGALDGTLQVLTDGLGNDSALSLSTAGASVGGTLAVSGAATLSSTLGVTGATTLSSLNTSGTISVGVTPANSTDPSIQSAYGLFHGRSEINITSNASFYDSGWKYIKNGYASRYYSNEYDGSHQWFTAPLGSAADAVTFTERMRIHGGGDISFRDSSANEAFYWDASAASLGIGTATIDAKLQVAGNISLGRYNVGSSRWIGISNGGGGFGDSSGANIEFTASGGVNDMRFYTYSGSAYAERMRIDSSGNVGIGGIPTSIGTGITSFDAVGIGGAALVAKGTSVTGEFLAQDAAGGLFISTKTNHPLIFRANDTERMRITSGGYLKASDNGTYNNAAGIYHEFRQSANSAALAIRATNASFTDKVISIEADRNTTDNTYYAISYYNYGTGTYRFLVADSGNVTNTNNSYGAISDIKVKENIVDATPKLDKLMDVRVVNYNLIGDDKKQLGVVAQELEQVFPSMVDESKDYEEVEVPQLDENGQEVLDENGEVVMTKERVDLGTVTKSVKYSVFVPMLIKAMQEQQEIINDLKARIEQLEA